MLSPIKVYEEVVLSMIEPKVIFVDLDGTILKDYHEIHEENLSALKELNNNTEAFIVGSDQVWRYDLYKFHGGNIYQLDFVNDDRKKIAYSASFGADKFIAPQLEKNIFKHYIKYYNNYHKG